MLTGQLNFTKETFDIREIKFGFLPDLIFVFSSLEFFQKEGNVKAIAHKYPNTIIGGCSTAGEVSGNKALTNTIEISAVKFDSSQVKHTYVHFSDGDDSKEVGEKLVSGIEKEGLKHVFVLAPGVKINGSDFVTGIKSVLPQGISITGGLAGDEGHFEETFVIYNSSKIGRNYATAYAFYGEKLSVGFGSEGGWDSFGIERKVTKSKDNILYELDGVPALGLYKNYLGEKAHELPGSALLFPLSVRSDADEKPLVRTVLGINSDDMSMTFAGNIPQNGYVKLMKANLNRLIDGAEKAANIACQPIGESNAQFVILISCVGRRLVLKKLLNEEVEAVNEVFSGSPTTTGFYSNGEISPMDNSSSCQLHNQSMSVTVFFEN